MATEQLVRSHATLHKFLFTEPSVMKSEDTNGETIGAKSDLKSARPRTGTFNSVLSTLVTKCGN